MAREWKVSCSEASHKAEVVGKHKWQESHHFFVSSWLLLIIISRVQWLKKGFLHVKQQQVISSVCHCRPTIHKTRNANKSFASKGVIVSHFLFISSNLTLLTLFLWTLVICDASCVCFVDTVLMMKTCWLSFLLRKSKQPPLAAWWKQSKLRKHCQLASSLGVNNALHTHEATMTTAMSIGVQWTKQALILDSLDHCPCARTFPLSLILPNFIQNPVVQQVLVCRMLRCFAKSQPNRWTQQRFQLCGRPTSKTPLQLTWPLMQPLIDNKCTPLFQAKICSEATAHAFNQIHCWFKKQVGMTVKIVMSSQSHPHLLRTVCQTKEGRWAQSKGCVKCQNHAQRIMTSRLEGTPWFQKCGSTRTINDGQQFVEHCIEASTHARNQCEQHKLVWDHTGNLGFDCSTQGVHSHRWIPKWHCTSECWTQLFPFVNFILVPSPFTFITTSFHIAHRWFSREGGRVQRWYDAVPVWYVFHLRTSRSTMSNTY